MRRALASVLGAVVWLAAPMVMSAERGSVLEKLEDEAAEVERRYGGDLGRLAAWAAEHGLAEEARTARAASVRSPEGTLSLRVIPATARGTTEPSDRPAAPAATPKEAKTGDVRREWAERWSKVRRPHGEALFKIVRAAADAGLVAQAYAWLWDTLAIDPDHEVARAALGYTRQEGRWLTRFEAQKLQLGQIWDDRFGWVALEHLERYEEGLRFFRGRWVSEAEEGRLRRQWSNAWQIESEHYLIRTNYDLARGLAVARELEQLREAFARLIPLYVIARPQLAELVRQAAAGLRDGSGVRLPPRLALKVWYFADKQEYVDTVRKYSPTPLGVSTGIYLPHKQTAYFYYNEEFDRPTLLHEATHQLFSESREGRQAARTKGNFWAVEGIACYMESLRVAGDRLLLGGSDVPRLVAARYRALTDGFYVPLERFVTLGLHDFNGADQDLPKYYSQSAGLCHFFMHYEGGRYRQGFLDYLGAIYGGRAGAGALEAAIGVDLRTLDGQYLDFLRQTGGG